MERVEIEVTPVPADNPNAPEQKLTAVDNSTGTTGSVSVSIDTPAETGAPAEAQDRPAWLPAKFKTAEELAASYAALEKRLGAGPAGTPSPTLTPSPTGTITPAAAPKPGAGGALTDVDFAELGTEFAAKGALTDASYQRLAGKGIPKDVVDTFIQGAQAIAARDLSELVAPIGGMEAYAQVADWASKNVSPAELESYNKVMGGADKNMKALAVAGLNARYSATNGREPAAQLTGRSAAGGARGYSSQAEMMRDMRHPAYKHDPAYRAEVERRIAATN